MVREMHDRRATATTSRLGRRSSKTIAGASTAFLYDGLNPVQELIGGAPSANILAGLNLDEFFTRTTSSSSQSFLTDALGSVVDGTGALQTQYGYAPYGSTMQSGTANDISYQYTGRENDGTGLYYYRARYYDPVLKRFIQEDPIGLAGGDVNLYAYVFGNPIDFTDPDGLKGRGKGKGKGTAWGKGDTGLVDALAEGLSPPNVNFGNPLPGWPKEPKPSCYEVCGPPNTCFATPPGAYPSLFKPGCFTVCTDGPVIGPSSNR